MNKLLASLFAAAALSFATSSFAADAPKPAEPAKMETAASPEAAKPAMKHHHKHVKKAAVEATAAAPAEAK